MEELGSVIQYPGQNTSSVTYISVVQDFYFYLFFSPHPFSFAFVYLCMLENSCRDNCLPLLCLQSHGFTAYCNGPMYWNPQKETTYVLLPEYRVSIWYSIRKKVFAVRTIIHQNNLSQWGTQWSPHCWRFSRCDWTACWVISSRLHCPGKIGQSNILRSLPAWSVLQFCGSTSPFYSS